MNEEVMNEEVSAPVVEEGSRNIFPESIAETPPGKRDSC